MIMNTLKSSKFSTPIGSLNALVAGLLLLAGCATSTVSAGTLMDVKVVDRSTGQVLETWRHRGQLYVVGTPGNRYAVQIANRSGGRVLSVLSVDGVNVLNGETAAASQSGYVLAPGQSADIAGWRKNMDEVAAFYFTSVADSYAGRTGRPENTGVIGVAVYRELLPPPVAVQPAPMARGYAENRDSGLAGASSAPSAPAAPAMEGRAKAEAADSLARSDRAEKKLGTGHGERLNAPTEYTSFQRASSAPAEIITIYYDSRANLMARGIIPNPRYQVRPNPFPGTFVPDPRG
jgi:hypothetical protein